MNRKIWAVIVTHHPDMDGFGKQLQVLAPQVEGMIVVDNASSTEVLGRVQSALPGERSSLIPLGGNKGIAAAQNIGIAAAKERGATHVILFDQDSLPAADMVEYLYLALEQTRQESGADVAAVGPRHLDDRRAGEASFARLEDGRVKLLDCHDDAAICDVDFLIASGCLIPMSVLDTVGGMREELFIDCVDTDWVFRARAKGFRVLGVCGAKMGHSIGDASVRLFGRSYALHSPVRHYYQFRNAIYLYRQSIAPKDWKRHDAKRLLLRYGAYTWFGRPRIQHWWMMTKGIWHGMIGRMGPL